jgi:hypothetical protein
MTTPHEDLLKMAIKAIEKVAQDDSVPGDQRIHELQALRDFCDTEAHIALPEVPPGRGYATTGCDDR